MKRVLEQDFSFFAAAAAGDSSRDPRASELLSSFSSGCNEYSNILCYADV